MKQQMLMTLDPLCPSCRGPLKTALVDLDEEMRICTTCGWEEGDEDPSDQDQGVLWIEEVNRGGK